MRFVGSGQPADGCSLCSRCDRNVVRKTVFGAAPGSARSPPSLGTADEQGGHTGPLPRTLGRPSVTLVVGDTSHAHWQDPPDSATPRETLMDSDPSPQHAGSGSSLVADAWLAGPPGGPQGGPLAAWMWVLAAGMRSRGKAGVLGSGPCRGLGTCEDTWACPGGWGRSLTITCLHCALSFLATTMIRTDNSLAHGANSPASEPAVSSECAGKEAGGGGSAVPRHEQP